jgi:hypothetical protein
VSSISCLSFLLLIAPAEPIQADTIMIDADLTGRVLDDGPQRMIRPSRITSSLTLRWSAIPFPTSNSEISSSST